MRRLGGLSGIVLAGGKSRRMRRDKTELAVGGVPVMERILNALNEAGAFETLIVGGSPERFEVYGVRVAPDDPPGFGVVGGIAAGLSAMRGDAALTVGCDMPFLTGELLKRIASRLEDADAAAAETDRGIEPLCAAYRKSAEHVFRAMMREGDLAARNAARRLRLNRVLLKGEDARRLFNMNAPEDHALAQRLAAEMDGS